MSRLTRRELWGVLAVTLAAILVRTYGLGFPNYHWDENIDFNNVFSASYNRLALLTYVHGSLHPYLILATWSFYFLFGGIELTTSNLIYTFFINPVPLTTIARGLAVSASTATIIMTFVLGKRLYNPRVGWLSSIFLAGTFLHAAESHYARTHTLAGFLVIFVLYFSSRIIKTGNQKDYLFAGISLGLAVAAQYSMFTAATPILYAHIVRFISIKPKPPINLWTQRSLLASAGIAVIAFFCVTPYALIDAQRFFVEIKFILGDVTHVWVDPQGQPIWLFFLTEHLKNGMGIFLAFTAATGFIYTFVRRSNSDFLLFAFLMPSFLTLANSANFARYLVPSLPPLTILAASLFDSIFYRLETRTPVKWMHAVQILVTAVVLAQPVMNILRFDFWLTQQDTRQIASEWITSHIAPGSRIVIEGENVLGPNVPLDRKYMEQLLAIQQKGSLGEIYTEALMNAQPFDSGYIVLSVFRLDQKHNGGIFLETISDVSYYRDLGYDYLITSSWMQRTPSDGYSPEFQASLIEYYEPIMTFEPTIYFRYDPYAWQIDYIALAQITPWKQGIGGPKLTIYQLRENKTGDGG
jgi:hypothetical protein